MNGDGIATVNKYESSLKSKEHIKHIRRKVVKNVDEHVQNRLQEKVC